MSPGKTTNRDTARQQTEEVLTELKGLSDDALPRAKPLVETLRNLREYELMGQLAEAISRHDPKDAKNRRLYAQYLIDTGKATAAVDMLQAAVKWVGKDDPEFAEITGLLGRAHKQVFFDTGDKTSPAARGALKNAINAYAGPYRENANNTWHGVNLVALLSRARGLGIRVAAGLKPEEIAKDLLQKLEAVPDAQRDVWHLPTLAEASLGLRRWDEIEPRIKTYIAAPNVEAFQIASTLRQFTEVWDLENTDSRGRSLIDILRARLMQLQGGTLDLSPQKLQALRKQPEPDSQQLEAVLGVDGPQTYKWWKQGLERAVSVAAIRRKNGDRLGTGFLVRAKDLGRAEGDELLVFTNFHVVNEYGASPGIQPGEAEIVFEAVDASRPYDVKEILWSAPTDRHDASLLRLASPVEAVAPLPIAKALPVIDPATRLYVIGHPGGRDLAFSFQDNELLDHEGPPEGRPQIPGVCRIHYRTPTEGGSSGSPVFNGMLWEVVALHHKGGKIGMPKLNGKDGTYAANEGISMISIREAMQA